MTTRLVPYLPGIVLFFIAVAVGMLVYQDYGMAWDEPGQRGIGLVDYEYVFEHSNSLFTQPSVHHGAAFEIALLIIEKKLLHITDTREMYQMRHLVTHLLFLISAFFGYILVYRLFKSRFTACLGFVMLAFGPRMYAHSFFNSKDLPFLSMVIIVFALFQLAFSKNKPVYFVLLGIAAGFATDVRVMGIMFAVIALLFLCIDIITGIVKKERVLQPIINCFAFTAAFCGSLYAFWPYLWHSPVQHFVETFNGMAHFGFWQGVVLFEGKKIVYTDIPWTYFPVWFLISNPPVWLMAGFGGIIWLGCIFLKRPLSFITNTDNRNFLLYIMCFFVPVMAVIALHSVIYDDWRHLYFVYPPFVLLALYCINKLLHTHIKNAVVALCVVQVAGIGYFMVHSHPFQQVYFNSFISHRPEYLRRNYDLEYWGCSYKQALDYLVATHPTGVIRINWDMEPLANNIMMLRKPDRDRIIMDDATPEYRITNFRLHPDDFVYPKVEYSVKVLNSTILCVYKMH